VQLSSRNLLLTPGPTPVPPAVAAAEAAPLAHHRSPEFRAAFERVRMGLKRVYRTSNEVLVFAASGTGAMESAFANLLSQGDPILVVSAGNFGERWVRVGEAYGARVEALRYAPGTRPDPAQVAARIAGRDDLVAAFVVHSETSTGATADLEAIAEACRDRSAVLVVDAISSLGAAPLETDAWGLDVVVTGSQKALMTPPGLAFASVSPQAMQRAESASSPRFYFDWRRARDAQAKGQTAFTPAISLLQGLDVALAQIEDTGLEVLHARTRAMGAGLRAATRALGLELFSPDHPDCSLVTAVRWPEGVDGEAVRRALRDRHGITVAGGQGELAGQIFRIGAFGAIEPRDLVAGLAALEVELLAAGHVVERGAGVGAFLRAAEADGER
jgi:aspartate aminotransferase-like enzyme